MTAAGTASLTVDYVNPVLMATRTVFETMLGCSPKRTGLMLKSANSPHFELSSVIGVTGKAVGTIVVSFSKKVAIEVLKRMLDHDATEINDEVRDAVGELTNMIAGAAKAKLAHLELSISIPNMVSGEAHEIHYPSNVQPICITFESDLGPFVIEVGFATPSGRP